MIVKGSARGKARDLAKHLQKHENEAVWVVGCQGVLADDIEGALIEMDAQGAPLKTTRTLYHGSINPEPGKDREMNPTQWDYACAAYLKKMGLDNQPYIIVGHKKIGKDGVLREHRHIVSARADLENMRAVRCDHNYRKHEEVAREIERYLGHEKVQGAHVDRNGARPDRTATHAQHQQAERGAVSAKEAKALGAELWKATDSGKALNAGLEAHGWMLARGDKARADGGAYFMAIDPQGGTHELRRMVPVKAAVLYARMADLAPASLPTVKTAKTFQLERAAAREAQEREKLGGRSDAPRPSHMRTGGPENGRQGHSDSRTDGDRKNYSKQQNTAGHIREAWTASKDAGDLIAELAARNIRLARVMPDEARFNQQQRAVAKQLGRRIGTLKEGEIVAVDGRGHAYRFDKRTTGAERGEIAQRLAGVDAGFLPGVNATQDAMRAASRAAWKEQRRIEREKARPVSKIEQAILDAAKAAAGDALNFAAALRTQGIALRVASAADVWALDALRKNDELNRVVAAANDVAYRQAPFLADVREGELAAVLKSGAVLRLNPHHLLPALAAVGIIAERQPAKGPHMEPDTETGKAEPTPEAGEVDVWNAYVRACGEAYQRYGFSFSRGPDDKFVNSLTLPEPQNAVEQAALDRYRDAWEERTGVRPEIIFERQTPEPTPAPSAAEKSRDVGNNPAARETPLGEARAGFETERGEAAQFQQGMIDIQAERRDEATRARVLASENRDAEQADRMADAALANTVYDLADTVAATVHRAERVASGFFAAFANRIEAAFEYLHGIVSPPPKLTAQQVHDTLQAEVGNLEKDNARDVAAAVVETEAAREWSALNLTSAQQEKDLRLSQALGTNVTAETNLNRDEHDRQREHDRERDYGREL